MRDSGKPTPSTSSRTAFMKLRIVQKRFAHAHKNDVDALALHIHLAVIQHGDDLAHDFSGAQVAFYAQQRGEAELAIHGAAYLAGNADGRAMPFRVAGFSAVAGLAVIAFGHPDGLNGFSVGHGDEVADGSVSGLKAFLNARMLECRDLLVAAPRETAWATWRRSRARRAAGGIERQKAGAPEIRAAQIFVQSR